VAFNIAFVQPETEFVNISTKVFFAGMMINAMQTAFQYREYALNAVSCNILTGVFIFAVVYAFMFVVWNKPLIGLIFIGMNC
jgi:hypothetical protein